MAGRDGRLVVVSCDVARCVSAGAVAPTLQAALDHSARSAPRLPALAGALDAGDAPGQPFDDAHCASPLLQAYQWADGSAYVNHVQLVRRARAWRRPTASGPIH